MKNVSRFCYQPRKGGEVSAHKLRGVVVLPAMIAQLIGAHRGSPVPISDGLKMMKLDAEGFARTHITAVDDSVAIVEQLVELIEQAT